MKLPQMSLTTSVLAILLPMAHAQNHLTIVDTGFPVAIPGSGGECEPACKINLDNVSGCTGSVSFTDTCLANFDEPGPGSVDVDGCDGWEAKWIAGSGDQSGEVFIMFTEPDGLSTTFGVPSCSAVDSSGGSQCAPSGGGCSGVA